MNREKRLECGKKLPDDYVANICEKCIRKHSVGKPIDLLKEEERVSRLTFHKWCLEYVKLLRERDPKWDYQRAMELARSEKDEFDIGERPIEALDKQMSSWTNDCPND